MKNKKILIAGGSGFIGSALAKWFGADNEIVILTRNTKEKNNSFVKRECQNSNDNIRFVTWNGTDLGAWQNEIEGTHLLINLCGKSVNCRYNANNKRDIFDSRTKSTAILGEAIRKATVPPKLWINAASATIYRHALDRPQDELNGEIENDFSVQVCKRWEQTFFEQRTPFTRKIALRMAIALGTDGVLLPFMNLVKFGLGGPQGNGRQMFSWVHIHDLCRTIEHCEENTQMEGVYNCCAPNPVSNRTFMQVLRKETGHTVGLPAPAWLLKPGTLVMGTEAELLLKSRWVVPTKLLATGFQFQYPQLQGAVQQIVGEMPRHSYHLF